MLSDCLNCTIHGGRIELVPQCAEHAAEMYPILSDESLYEFTEGSPPACLSWLSARHERLETRHSPDGTQLWLNWVVRLKASRRLIGYVQATVRDREADVSWVIGADWQGHGYGTEASTLMLGQLKQAGIQSIASRIHSANLASLGIARNLGMKRIGLVENGDEVWGLPV